MIYTIERRSTFGEGSMESHYEVIRYERRTKIGILVGGKVVFVCKTKKEAKEFCRENHINYVDTKSV